MIIVGLLTDDKIYYEKQETEKTGQNPELSTYKIIVVVLQIWSKMCYLFHSIHEN